MTWHLARKWVINAVCWGGTGLHPKQQVIVTCDMRTGYCEIHERLKGKADSTHTECDECACDQTHLTCPRDALRMFVSLTE